MQRGVAAARNRRTFQCKQGRDFGRDEVYVPQSSFGPDWTSLLTAGRDRCSVPLTTVSASVSTSSISFPPSTTTKLKFNADLPFGVIVAVPLPFASTE